MKETDLMCLFERLVMKYGGSVKKLNGELWGWEINIGCYCYEFTRGSCLESAIFEAISGLAHSYCEEMEGRVHKCELLKGAT